MISLLLLMAMVGFVELGTDSWISNITGNLLADPKKGLYLFIWTSTPDVRPPVRRRADRAPDLAAGSVICCRLLRMRGAGPAQHGRRGVQPRRGRRRGHDRGDDLRLRQDVLLGDDAGRDRRAVPTGRRPGDRGHRLRRQPLGGRARRAGHRPDAGSIRLGGPATKLARRLGEISVGDREFLPRLPRPGAGQQQGGRTPGQRRSAREGPRRR